MQVEAGRVDRVPHTVSSSMPATLPWHSAWLEISTSACVQPAASMRASLAANAAGERRLLNAGAARHMPS